MANPEKGETDLKLDGKTFIICLTAHEIVKIEQLYDVGITEISTWFQSQNMRLWRMQALLWAALQRHHSEVTIDQALDMIATSENLKAVLPKLIEAINMSFPPAVASDEENPQ